ncbi:sodium-dependent glucose transporter 1 [Plakobranchus ocellatus]|uniref:Sodium-dependent glucose transporter 1 n=1 Tax=Plakobranchus ocellatus TaxID=259542 RepID=A0AAV4AWI8_9GAST|nr:sodium-dependent glucose transporter 1 [Plakobranchus ocellatus]
MSGTRDKVEKYKDNNVQRQSLLPSETVLYGSDGCPVSSPGCPHKSSDDGHRFNCSNNESVLSDPDLKDESETNCPVKLNFVSDFRRKFQEDALYRGNLKHSLCLAIALFCLGVVEAQNGPTFLDLQIITGTNVGQASAFFTANSCGALLGSTASGYISGRKFCCSMGGVVSPLVTEPFLAARSDHKTVHHNSDIDDQHQQNPITEAAYDKDRDGYKFPSDSINTIFEGLNVTRSSFIPAKNISYYSNTTPSPDESSRSTNVHWAFLITGLIVIVASTPFFFLYNKSRRAKKNAKRNQSEKDSEKASFADDATSVYRKIPLRTYICLLAALCTFFILYCSVENTFLNFLMTFVVRRFRTVSKSDGAHITAVFWGSFAASRFLMIFVSRALSPVRMLYLGGSLMLVAFSGFTVSSGAWADRGFGDTGLSSLSTPTNSSFGFSSVANLSTAEWDPAISLAENETLGQADVPGSVPALTFFTAMSGLGMSGVFPAGMSWCGAELLKVTGRVTSILFVSASCGVMLNPLLVSRLMQDWSNLWFCYVLLLEISALALVFVGLLALNRCYLIKKYGKLHGMCPDDIVTPANDHGDDIKNENSVAIDMQEPISDFKANETAKPLFTKQ